MTFCSLTYYYFIYIIGNGLETKTDKYIAIKCHKIRITHQMTILNYLFPKFVVVVTIRKQCAKYFTKFSQRERATKIEIDINNNKI